MVIVISSPTPVTKEASLINQLFDEGLPVFHLRKPDSSSQELVLLLQEIDSIHHSKIALHSHHYLAKSFGINRLHYTEASRKQLTHVDFSENENTLSTSVHSVEDFTNLSEHFSYAFLSPVFNSISKPDYEAKPFDLSELSKNKTTKLIALGGIDETNCGKAYEMGFDGIALLGAIWNSEDKINAFKNILSQCPTTVL
ncbi:MAG: thiamine monophosphate synthase [Bacteroidetes bacterium]|jgi:thiamine-phosphate pyrophosphorylase|nr:thiamine monophosphate synthase [Bacteroidota bacterium]MDF2451057.1 thiamine monophosphate synthase [Bacteroidota bacterium]